MAADSGLSRGGTSGTLSLSLTTGCSTNQVLQWTGSKWACSSAGAGTITGVTAGTDLTGGGTSGSVTLNLDTTKVPQLAANNTFTGTQTIENTVGVTGSNSAQMLQVTNTATSGATAAISAVGDSTGGYAVLGTSPRVGVYGIMDQPSELGLLLGGRRNLGDTAEQGYTAINGTADDGQAGYFANNSPSGYSTVVAVANTTTGAGAAVYGQTDSTNAGAVGVFGLQDAASGAGTGVFGQSNGSGGYGVEGASSYVGVYGSADGGSVTGFLFGGWAGVYGDTGGTGYSGVVGTADNNNAFFINNSGSNTTIDGAALLAQNLSGDLSAMVLWAGSSSDYCNVNIGGHLSCTGGTDAVVPADHGARRVTLHAVQSAENWFEDFGSATLVNGVARVALDPTFASTVSTTAEYHVFLTPRGECEGLYVAATTLTGFEVRELHGGTSGVAFDYRIVAKRAGYEKSRLEDVTEWYRKNQELSQLQRERMQQRRAARAAAALATPSAGKVVAPRVVPAPNIARPVPQQR